MEAAVRLENARLCGSWNADGRSGGEWKAMPMWPSDDADGGTVFRTKISFDSGEIEDIQMGHSRRRTRPNEPLGHDGCAK
jgi:hypothetical protein